MISTECICFVEFPLSVLVCTFSYPSVDVRNKQDGSKGTNHSFMSLYAKVHKVKRSCHWVVIAVFRSALFVFYVERWMWKRINTESSFTPAFSVPCIAATFQHHSAIIFRHHLSTCCLKSANRNQS